jgi:hypothetical protein
MQLYHGIPWKGSDLCGDFEMDRILNMPPSCKCKFCCCTVNVSKFNLQQARNCVGRSKKNLFGVCQLALIIPIEFTQVLWLEYCILQLAFSDCL